MKPSAALEANRGLIRRGVLAHRASNPRVFGSVLRGEDSDECSLDILVAPASDASLLDIAHIQKELEASLGVAMDILTPGALPVRFRTHVLKEARTV